MYIRLGLLHVREFEAKREVLRRSFLGVTVEREELVT